MSHNNSYEDPEVFTNTLSSQQVSCGSNTCTIDCSCNSDKGWHDSGTYAGTSGLDYATRTSENSYAKLNNKQKTCVHKCSYTASSTTKCEDGYSTAVTKCDNGFTLETTTCTTTTTYTSTLNGCSKGNATANPTGGKCVCNGTVGCDGVCNSGKVNDCAGKCGGSAKPDCAGTCNGSKVSDGQGGCCLASEKDCAGTCNGPKVSDKNGGCCLATDKGCDNVCNSGKVNDCAGKCGGSAKPDCAGTCNGSKVTDSKGGCCLAKDKGCDGICNSGAFFTCLGDYPNENAPSPEACYPNRGTSTTVCSGNTSIKGSGTCYKYGAKKTLAEERITPKTKDQCAEDEYFETLNSQCNTYTTCSDCDYTRSNTEFTCNTGYSADVKKASCTEDQTFIYVDVVRTETYTSTSGAADECKPYKSTANKTRCGHCCPKGKTCGTEGCKEHYDAPCGSYCKTCNDACSYQYFKATTQATCGKDSFENAGQCWNDGCCKANMGKVTSVSFNPGEISNLIKKDSKTCKDGDVTKYETLCDSTLPTSCGNRNGTVVCETEAYSVGKLKIFGKKYYQCGACKTGYYETQAACEKAITDKDAQSCSGSDNACWELKSNYFTVTLSRNDAPYSSSGDGTSYGSIAAGCKKCTKGKGNDIYNYMLRPYIYDGDGKQITTTTGSENNIVTGKVPGKGKICIYQEYAYAVDNFQQCIHYNVEYFNINTVKYCPNLAGCTTNKGKEDGEYATCWDFDFEKGKNYQIVPKISAVINNNWDI